MMKLWKARGLMAVTLTIVLALLVTACAPGKPVVEEKKIRIPLSVSLTGPVASQTWRLSWGMIDYLRYINDQGGIEYRYPEGYTERVKLHLLWEDSQFNTAKALSIYKRQSRPDVLVMYMTAGSMAETCLGMMVKDRMPVVGNEFRTIITTQTDPVFFIAELPGYVGVESTYVKWAKDNWRLERRPKLAVICIDTPSGRGQQPGGLPDYCASIGVDFVAVEWLPFMVTDATIELTRLAARGVDWIFMIHTSASVAVILKDAMRLGIRDEVQFCGYTLDPLVLDLAPEAGEGLYGQLHTALPDEDVPGVRLAKEIAMNYNPDLANSVLYYKGMFVSMCLVEGLRIALERVGYEGLTRDIVREGLVSIKDFDSGGVCPPATVEDPKYPVLNSYVRVGVFEGGKIKPVSDWIKAPLIW